MSRNLVKTPKVACERDGADIPPEDPMAVSTDRVQVARRCISGLTGAGVEPVEAILGFVPHLKLSELIGLVFEMIPDPFKCMKTLCAIAETLPKEQLPELGRIMLSEHGINPVSVAVCAANQHEAKLLAHQMRVDAWLAECITYVNIHPNVALWISLKNAPMVDSVVEIPGALILPTLHLPTHRHDFSRVNRTLNSGPIVIEGDLRIEEAVRFTMTGLKSIGGKLLGALSSEISFPNLESVGEGIWLNSSRELDLPKLTHVNEDINLIKARDFSAPALEHVGGRVLRDDEDPFVSFPSLRFLVGKAYVHAGDVDPSSRYRYGQHVGGPE